jgi:rod shape-determining protein MreD
MIMRPGQQLLLPANPLFIWTSLIIALLCNMLFASMWSRAAWLPDVLAIVLVFWTVHQPQRVGIGVAFLFGLCMDVQQAALLGQHAWSYTALSFLAIAIHRRLLWFSGPSQALQVLPLFLVSHALELMVRMIGGGSFPGVWVMLAPACEALLWPLVSVFLLSPQRRAPDPDANRPL